MTAGPVLVEARAAVAEGRLSLKAGCLVAAVLGTLEQ